MDLNPIAQHKLNELASFQRCRLLEEKNCKIIERNALTRIERVARPAKRYNFSDESPQSGEDDAITASWPIAKEARDRLNVNHDDDVTFRCNDDLLIGSRMHAAAFPESRAIEFRGSEARD